MLKLDIRMQLYGGGSWYGTVEHYSWLTPTSKSTIGMWTFWGAMR